MQVFGYIVAQTDKAVAFVARRDMVDGVRPFWVPRAKIENLREEDRISQIIKTADSAERVGIPHTITIDNDFASKIGYTFSS